MQHEINPDVFRAMHQRLEILEERVHRMDWNNFLSTIVLPAIVAAVTAFVTGKLA